jgi:hypothetical protein
MADHDRPDFAHNICFEKGMCLVGASYDDRALSPGGLLNVQLHWQIHKPVGDDYVMFVHLLDRDGNAIAGVNEFPFFHGYRTYEWQAGETAISQTNVIVPADAQPGPYAIEVGFYLPYTFERLKTVAPDGSVTGDRAYLPDLKVPRPEVQLPGDSIPAEIVFGDEIALAGYRIDSLPDGSQPLRMTLWWRSLAPASQDWTGFYHLTPASDSVSLVGQTDRSLTGGAYPPTIWDRGELVEEQIEVAPAALAAGKYAVWMGLYSPLTFERLAITSSPNPIQDNRTLLVEFEIKP